MNKMDKTQGFFDPYNFNLQNSNMQNSQAQNIPQTQTIPGMEVQQMISPNMYYEQQYMYYKYLTQMIEYKIKLLNVIFELYRIPVKFKIVKWKITNYFNILFTNQLYLEENLKHLFVLYHYNYWYRNQV